MTINQSGSLCTHCGTDSVLLEKTVELSNRMYNKGLAEAKSGNLTFAIESLSKSVSYNRNNSAARNLLGLVYYEYGRVADACRHWVISASMLRKDNPAQKYLGIIQDNPEEFEKYSEAIEKYNSALAYIKQMNEDMAVIQLKRAIELNPKFIDALNLTALCSLIQKDKDQATQAVERVLLMDISNPAALTYYKNLYPGRGRYNVVKRDPRAPAAGTKPTTSSFIFAPPKKTFNIFHLVTVILFVAGVVCTAAFFFIAVIPPMVADSKSEAESLSRQLAVLEAETEQKLKEKDTEINDILAQNELAASERDNLTAELLRQDKVNKVNTADALMREERYEEAAEYLYRLDVSDLNRETQDLYDNMITVSVYPIVVNDLYERGVESFEAEDYDEAKQLLEKALRFAEDSTLAKSDIIYYLGRTAQSAGETDTATAYYTDILDNYPDASQTVRESCETRIDALRSQ